MRKKVSVVALCLCIAIVSVSPALAANVPAYPQAFRLLPGEQTSFGFPLVKAGSVQAEVQWQGGMPLAVSLVDITGRTVATVQPSGSPARLSYNATADDAARAILWKLVLAYPNASGAAASGSVLVRFPAVDPAQMARLDQALAALPKPILARPTTMPAAHKASVAQALAELTAPTQQRIATYKTQADARYATVTRSASISTSATAPASTSYASPAVASAMQSLSPRVQTNRFLSQAQITAAVTGRIPTLLDAAPAQAAPGQQVVLNGKFFTVQNGLYQAAFTVRGAYMQTQHTNDPNRPVNVVEVPPLVLTVPVESVTQLPDGRQQLLVHAPMPPAGSTLTPFDGDVSVKTATGFASNPVSFRYQVSVPNPQSITPFETKAGAQVTINGLQFAATDVVHIVLNDGVDRVVPSTFASEAAIRFTVPAYSSRTRFDAKVYMTRVVNGVPIASRDVYFVLGGTEMDITGLSVQQAPMDAPMVITGINFEGTPQVTFKLGGTSYAGTVTQSSPTAIYVTVPKMGGVSVNTSCQVSVKCGTKTSSTPLTFTYIPTFAHEPLFICLSPFNTDIQFGEPLTSTTRLSGDGDRCFYGLWCAAPGELAQGERFIYSGHDTTQYIYFGKSGYDDYFPRTYLKNGWKLERVVVTKDSRSRGNVGAYLAENGIGTNSARIRIRWWGDAFGDIQYIVTPFITGPYGTSPY